MLMSYYKRTGVFIRLVIINCLWLFLFYKFFSIDFSTWRFSFVQIVMASILGAQLWGEYKGDEQPTIDFIVIYVTNIYFTFSSVKYVIPYNFIGFITDNNLRMLGSVCIFVSILIAIKTSRLGCTVDKSFYSNYSLLTYLLAWIISLGLLVYSISEYILNPLNVYVTQVRDVSTMASFGNFILQFTQCFGAYCCTMYWNKGIKRKVPAFLFVISTLLMTFSTGSRMIAVQWMVLILYLLVFVNKISQKRLQQIYYIGPIAIIMLTVLTFILSGRSTVRNSLIHNLAYRFDFADFPMTVLERKGYWFLELGEIGDGIKMSIPSFLVGTVGEGFKTKATYQQILASARLDIYTDYSDSIFSMGTLAFGICGMLFLFPLILYLYNKLEKCFFGKKQKGFLMWVLFIPIAMRVEIDTTYYISFWRNYLIMLFLAEIVFAIMNNFSNRVSK